jgi:hypothetical protein
MLVYFARNILSRICNLTRCLFLRVFTVCDSKKAKGAALKLQVSISYGRDIIFLKRDNCTCKMDACQRWCDPATEYNRSSLLIPSGNSPCIACPQNLVQLVHLQGKTFVTIEKTDGLSKLTTHRWISSSVTVT